MKKPLLFAAAVLCGALCANAQNYENGHEWVDLGLPSGLKWATMNVGADAPEAYGDYFAWGETEPKETYEEDNYKYGTLSYLTKYNTESGGGLVDNLTTLEASDDAAIQNWGGKWRMPAKDEWQELIDNCDWTWTDGYNDTEVAGYIVVGKNGNSIFLSATGFRSGDGLYTPYLGFYYWSSSLDPSTYLAYCPNVANMSNVADGAKISHTYRTDGLSVRAVCEAGGTPTALATATAAPAVRKILRDGQVLILRDGKTYTLTGAEVK